MPALLAGFMAKDLKIPIIGIGASNACGGQVLVQSDMLGTTERVPRFCKKYADHAETVPAAIRQYIAEVKDRSFPDPSRNTYEMPEDQWRRFMEMSETIPPP